jgi:2-keto-4-pentenoate hydratase/2-oxohepta-3-ene-1,7-dioic acid hydratase in catechol pathway
VRFPDYDAEFFASGGLVLLAGLGASGFSGLPEAARGQRVGAPIARPGSVICIGMNYAAHAAESGSEPPSAPVVFMKPPNTVAGPDDCVPIPRNSQKTDWEVELGVVIGAPALYLDSAEEAAASPGSCSPTTSPSVSSSWRSPAGSGRKARPRLGSLPSAPGWSRRRSSTTAPRACTAFVNGQPRQDSTTGDMIFDVGYLVWNLSQYMQLGPGDLILTGTPQGVALSGRFPYLRAGDVVELDIEGLGTQRQTFVPA